jgi:hypothetical protein
MKRSPVSLWYQDKGNPKWAEQAPFWTHPDYDEDIDDVEPEEVFVTPPPPPVQRMVGVGNTGSGLPIRAERAGCHTTKASPLPKAVDPVLLDEVRSGLKQLGLSKIYAEARITKVLDMTPVPDTLETFLIACLRK